MKRNYNWWGKNVGLWSQTGWGSGVGISREQTLRLSLVFQMFNFKTSLGINTYGREGWEEGEGTGEN